MSTTPIYVDCLLNGKLIKTYEFGKPIAQLPGAPTDQRQLEAECQSMLTTDRLAFPPYTGISFRHRER